MVQDKTYVSIIH